jgi:nicotinamide mononucleotide (NMN) deamidase PncC
VNEAAVRVMAEGALALTGIAGPSGGRAEQPVGTPFLALVT